MPDKAAKGIGTYLFLASAVLTGAVALFQLLDRFGPKTVSETTAPQVILLPDQTDLSDIEQRLVKQIRQNISAAGCEGITITDLQATGKRTEASQTTSGFDGYYLSGEVLLKPGDNEATGFYFEGNGKGPAAQADAVAMAAAGIGKNFAPLQTFMKLCT